jgi:Amt family ammonium transporter
MSAIALGALAAFPSYFGLVFRAKTSLDDSLDVVAAHGLGGTVGALLTGVFANKAINGVGDGLLFGNSWQLAVQAVAVLSTMIYSGVVSFGLLKLIGAITPLRAKADDEAIGMDVSQHGEEAYVHAEGSAAFAVESVRADAPALQPAQTMGSATA